MKELGQIDKESDNPYHPSRNGDVKSINSAVVRSAACFALIVIGLACTRNQITLGGPLSLTVSSNTPVSVSDSLVLQYDVTGQNLAGMQVLWGDGQIDSVAFWVPKPQEGGVPTSTTQKVPIPSEPQRLTSTKGAPFRSFR